MITKREHWSEEYEQAVLGAILLDEQVLPDVISILDIEDFYSNAHRLIYKQMLSLHNKGEKVDTITINEALRESKKLEKAGGAYYLTGLHESCPTSANAVDYTKKIWQCSQRRKIKQLAYKIYSGDPEEIAKSYTRLRELDIVPPWEKDHEAIIVQSLEDLLDDPTPPPTQLISRGLLPAQSILLPIGAPKTGKSILALNLALCLVGGRDWFQFKIEKPVKVLLIQAEVVKASLKERFLKMKDGCEFPIPKLSLFISEPYHCDIITDKGYEVITRIITKIQPEVVIFDPLSAFHTADENSNNEMEAVMSRFRDLTFLGLSVILIHHSRKEGGSSPISNPRGASAIAGSVDSIMELTEKEGTVTAKFDLRYDEAPDEMSFRLNPDTLWLERIRSEVEGKRNKQILKMLEGTDTEGVPLSEITKMLTEESGKTERTTRGWIHKFAKDTGIIEVIGSRNKKRVILT